MWSKHQPEDVIRGMKGFVQQTQWDTFCDDARQLTTSELNRHALVATSTSHHAPRGKECGCFCCAANHVKQERNQKKGN